MNVPPTADPRLQAEQFRERTSRMVPFNFAQRQCSACKQRRSAGRFIEGSDVCFDCRRRAK
jgi:hypothetical protein